MNIDTLGQGGRVLWSLRRRTSDVRCILYGGSPPVEVHVLQDRDLVLREIFAEEGIAISWAAEYASRLREHGWHDSSEDTHETGPDGVN